MTLPTVMTMRQEALSKKTELLSNLVLLIAIVAHSKVGSEPTYLK